MDCTYQLNNLISTYLSFCSTRKNLDAKTVKSYSIDLRQFTDFVFSKDIQWNTKKSVEEYIDILHNKYKPKSVKRKIASLKAFFHYLEIEEIIETNPFHKIQVKYKEPFILPKTIPLNLIEQIIKFAYAEQNNSTTYYSKRITLRNTLILELLFATGMRISELCSLTLDSLDSSNYVIKIHGKGSKERLIQICNKSIQDLINQYCKEFEYELSYKNFLFINRLGNRLSEQSVRNMITSYTEQANISLHITPHMFRHSFATLLLEEDVDIRYIQQMLGHSSITTTQIYTHTSINKQKSILTVKHPRNKIDIGI